MTDKKTARAQVSERKRQLSYKEVSELSAALAEKFLSLEEYKRAETIYAYIPCNQEVLTQGIIERAWADKKRVAVPKMINPCDMEFIYIYSFGELEAGYMGIKEPKEELLNDSGRIANSGNALVLAPGLAFDKNGGRAGYGKGCYDRYFASKAGCKFIMAALCYDFQIYDRLELEEHDKKMDIIISNSHIFRAAG